MSASTIGRRQAKNKDESREAVVAAFWNFSSNRYLLKDAERLRQFQEGFSAHLFRIVRVTFDLPDRDVETLFNASIPTLERRRREQKNLDPIASERLDRIASICHQVEEVFADKEATAIWMSKPNKALGGSTPILLCDTEIGARQVRRVLHALEWGNVT